jgi:hypothetical protein
LGIKAGSRKFEARRLILFVDRRQSPQRNGRQSKRQRPDECGAAGDKEEWEEMSLLCSNGLIIVLQGFCYHDRLAYGAARLTALVGEVAM